MFGDQTRDEITSNIFLTPGYPKWISNLIIACISIIPVTKLPLKCARLLPFMSFHRFILLTVL